MNWRPVLWGMLLNFLFALFILKTGIGLTIFKFIAQQVTTFLGYTSAGSDFVFGPAVNDHFFAFKVSTTLMIIQFSHDSRLSCSGPKSSTYTGWNWLPMFFLLR